MRLEIMVDHIDFDVDDEALEDEIEKNIYNFLMTYSESPADSWYVALRRR